MKSLDKVRIDPESIEMSGGADHLDVVIAHTESTLTAAVLTRAAQLLAGLTPKITLLAVQTVPFPASFASAAASHAHLVSELIDLAEQSPLAVTPHVVMARSRQEGFLYVLKSESTVLVGTRKHLWTSAEEKLARALARDGHKVALLRIER